MDEIIMSSNIYLEIVDRGIHAHGYRKFICIRCLLSVGGIIWKYENELPNWLLLLL